MCMFLAHLMYTKLAIWGVSTFKIYGKHAVIMKYCMNLTSFNMGVLQLPIRLFHYL